MAIVSAALLLAACATAPATSSAPSNNAGRTEPAQASRTAQFLHAAGRPNAPSRTEIDRVLGAPDIERQEGAGLALTYRFESCGLLLLFSADGRNEMRLAEAHASARRAGEATPSIETCAAEADARRP
jgi:hypothetical protein